MKKPKPKKLKRKKHFIRATKHPFNNYANLEKHLQVYVFLAHAREALKFYIDYLWNNEITWKTTNKKTNQTTTHILNIQKDQLDCPSMIKTKNLEPLDNQLSQRVLKCVATQACGMVKAVIEKKRRLLYGIEQEQNPQKLASLVKKLEKFKFSKPEVRHDHGIELNSICVDFVPRTKSFDQFIELKCLGIFEPIALPIKFHRRYHYWNNQNGQRLNSILLTNNRIEIRFKFPIAPLKTEGTKLGLDQGKEVLLYAHDHQRTTQCVHKHDLNSICDNLANRKENSKSFKKAQAHRENYINYSINKLNFNPYKEMSIEDLRFIKLGEPQYKDSTKHMSNPLIIKKLKKIDEERGVLLSLNHPAFRSQRCPICSFVFADNRVSRSKFCCKNCAYKDHADHVGALNNAIDLPEIPYAVFVNGKNNATGFFWTSEGIFDPQMKELTVPSTINH